MAEVTLDRWLPHPRAKVWRALSDPELAARWLPFDGYHARVGHRFMARGPRGDASCEVLQVQAPCLVELSWREEGFDGRLSLRLTEEREGTRVVLTHSSVPESHQHALLGMWSTAIEQGLRGALQASGIRWGPKLATVGLAVVGTAALVALVLRAPAPEVDCMDDPEPEAHLEAKPPEVGEPVVYEPVPAVAVPVAVVRSFPAREDLTRGDFVVYERSLPTTLNPLYPSSEVDRRTHTLVFDRLFYRSAITNEVKSRVVAEARTDGRRLKITLRDDVRFHDGEPLTAEDLCFSVNAVLDPRNPSTLPFLRRARLAGCVVESRLRAELRFHHAAADLRVLADVPLLPQHAFDSTMIAPDGDFGTRPIGTGPYSGVLGATMSRFVSHDSPHRRTTIPELTIEQASSDPMANTKMLLAGTVAGMVEVNPRHQADIRASDDVTLKTFGTRSMLYAALNPDTLSSPELRAAIRFALNVPRVCGAVTGEALDVVLPMCAPTSGPWLPSSPFYNRSVEVPIADARAVQASMLAAGATRSGKVWQIAGEPVTLRVGVDRAANSFLLGLAEEVGNQLRFAGYKVQLRPADAPNPMKMDLWVGRHVFDLSENAEDILRVGPLGAQTPEVTLGVEAMAMATTDTEQQDAAHDMHQVLAEQQWLLPLWSETRKSAWSFSVLNNIITPRTYWDEVNRWKVSGD